MGGNLYLSLDRRPPDGRAAVDKIRKTPVKMRFI
jgi:hypothetical protein